MKEEPEPSIEAIKYAEYILNHYSRSSTQDIYCLARDLEINHSWKNQNDSH